MKTLLVLTGVTSQMELDEELRSSGPSVRRRRFLPRGEGHTGYGNTRFPTKRVSRGMTFGLKWNETYVIYIYICLYVCISLGHLLFLLPRC